jgi:hypothetical protein
VRWVAHLVQHRFGLDGFDLLLDERVELNVL